MRKRLVPQAWGLRSYLARVTNFTVNDSRAYNGVNYFAVRSYKEIIGEIWYWDHELSFCHGEQNIRCMYFAMRYLFWRRGEMYRLAKVCGLGCLYHTRRALLPKVAAPSFARRHSDRSDGR